MVNLYIGECRVNKVDILRAIAMLEEQIEWSNTMPTDSVNWLTYANQIIARNSLIKELECLELA